MFTKGPWAIQKLQGMITITTYSYSEITPCGVASVWRSNWPFKEERPDDPIQDANARLIAAAPEMFDLIWDQIRAMGNTPMDDMNYSGTDWADRAKALIDKIVDYRD